MINGIKRLSSWLDEIRYFIYPEKALAMAGGAYIGSRMENHIAITAPPLQRPGGQARARAYGALSGTYRRIATTVKVTGATRPGGRGGTGCAAGVVSAYQRFTIKIN